MLLLSTQRPPPYAEPQLRARCYHPERNPDDDAKRERVVRFALLFCHNSDFEAISSSAEKQPQIINNHND